MSTVALAAITLHERGGGVAAASRLMWRACQERWGSDARLVTLLNQGDAHGTLGSSTSARLRFGTRLAKGQVLNQYRWIFYTHASLAQVQSHVPTPFRRPYGIFLHGIEVWRPFSAVQKRVVLGASLLLSNSSYTAERVRREHPWIGAIVPCPLALPTVDDATLPREDSEPVPDIGPHAVLVVGRLDAAEQYKGHDQLLDAWPLVRDRVPDAKLVFVGAGDDERRLRARAGACRVGDSVVFTGFVARRVLRALYERAALYAMPSRNEGFGLVYLEAMAHGLPCLGSVHDAAGEVIDDGVTGVLVDQSDIPGMADRIVELLVDERLRAEMGQRARERFQTRFAYERFRDRFVGLLDSALGSSEAAPLSATSSVR